MKHSYFASQEHHSSDVMLPLDEVLQNIAFNEAGLIPVIAQDVHSQEVLMLAWMNRHALELTLATKKMTYWSRSRQAIWKKGETSGNWQHVVSMSLDCDGDTLLCRVEQTGAACHTGRHHCFYLSINPDDNKVCVQKPWANHLSFHLLLR
ncbi:Phosphoribosyl-AMP cyclohydrolase [BD1-7 clade bacterium]|uniref:Phosphoribosyl-AMP cyclohydrolase n=1 Tax=BD1-7 clade bacterium TaxID=2029982 RepID=A0A5S9QZJ2_9GAMM|nr:Phosphoribosyl-AMP cyclohydrolase [BD1-7 clade bacterium]